MHIYSYGVAVVLYVMQYSQDIVYKQHTRYSKAQHARGFEMDSLRYAYVVPMDFLDWQQLQYHAYVTFATAGGAAAGEEGKQHTFFAVYHTPRYVT